MGWLAMCRPPFHSVGVLPFALGAVLARHVTGATSWALWGWGTLAVILIMLSAYLSGEYFDYEGDCIARQTHPSRFAGGSGALQAGLVPRHAPLTGSVVALTLAMIVGLIIQFGYRTGPWTIPLGAVGIVGGFFYAAPPLRWVAAGVGELWIAFCYGWLPIATAYYLPVGQFDSLVHWVSLPIAASIFNVILLNEYPDYQADRATGKRTILVRLGRARGARLFAAVHILGWLGALASVAWGGAPIQMLYYYALPFALSAGLAVAIMRGVYHNPDHLEIACGLNIAVNLTSTLAYIAVFC
jgi:1,4-dihydroxy-2-naphthoate polyprenyltransferase